MKIIYIITIIALYISFILVHKTDKKQNILMWLNIGLVLMLCYNTLISLICSFWGILCTLTNLSIINIIVICILNYIIFRNKKIQKYYIKPKDVIVSFVIFILVVCIAYTQYGFPFNIKYGITDGSTHYFFAQQFYENSQLLFKGNNDFLGLHNVDFRLPGAYVNQGILFKIFDNTIQQTQVFVLFDLTVLYLSGILFYYLLNTYVKENKKVYIVSIIFAIVYMIGYPLNSMLSGYVYLSLALDIILTLLILITKEEEEQIKYSIILPILSLISFGIFFSYAYFVPIIYIAIFINIFCNRTNNKLKKIAKILYIIIIPAILGLAYFILFPKIIGMKTEVSTIGVDGKIYENYITNFLFFIPFNIVYIIKVIKEKNNNKSIFGAVLFWLSILFAIILYIGYKMEIVSKYYFLKSYYIIWMLSIYNSFVAINYILNSKSKYFKIITYIAISIYVVDIFIFAIIFKKNIYINHIAYENTQIIRNSAEIFKFEEIKVIDYIKNSKIDMGNIYVLEDLTATEGENSWMWVLFNNQYIYIELFTGEYFNIEQWLKETMKKYYLAYYKDCKNIEIDENSSEYKKIYDDGYAFILERNTQ